MRVSVLGTSGCGKSTFARRLAAAIGAPHIELDAINWQAGWRDLNTHDPQEFARRVTDAVAAETWVSDGNYSLVRDIVMARVLRRSFLRALTRRELWPGTGNREEFGRWLSREHPIRWAWDTFEDRRRRMEALFADARAAHTVRHRLRRPAEAEPLLNTLQAEARKT